MPTTDANLWMYVHCRTCFDQRQRQQLDVGLDPDGVTLHVFCTICNSVVADFTLRERVATPLCANPECSHENHRQN